MSSVSTSRSTSTIFDVEEIKRQLPPASKFTCPAAGSGDFDSDPQYRNLVERLGSAKQKMPGLSKARKDMLKALCSGLGIYYNEKQDCNADIVNRLKIYVCISSFSYVSMA